jgi:hypothetical protein
MATYQLGYYPIENMTISDLGSGSPALLGGSLATNQPGSTGAGAVGDRFVLSSDALVTITVSDDDLNFQDGDVTSGNAANNQIIVSGPNTGSTVQAEYSVQVQAVVNGVPTGPVITLYAVNVGTNNGVGLIGPPGALQPGVTYQVVGAVDGPTIPFLDLACFTHGTLIDTPDGLRLIEELGAGDLITTLDNGSQQLRWIGSRSVSRQEMVLNSALRPVLFEIGSIGNSRPLLVSPQHRMLLNDWRAQVYFGEDQVLIAAKAMVNGKTIRQILPENGVTYCHLLFDRHEVILAEGALSESFHPGEIGLGGLDDDQRREIETLFPQLVLEERRAAFPIVRPGEVRGLPLAG